MTHTYIDPEKELRKQALVADYRDYMEKTAPEHPQAPQELVLQTPYYQIPRSLNAQWHHKIAEETRERAMKKAIDVMENSVVQKSTYIRLLPLPRAREKECKYRETLVSFLLVM